MQNKKKDEKIRIVVEISKNDYKALVALKNLFRIHWREIIIAGAVWWIDNLDLERKIYNLKDEIEKLKN